VGVRDYRDLIIWRKGTELAKEVYRLSRTFPPVERFGLASQIQRAAVSIPSNIAEGQSRRNTAEFRQYLHHALGSLAEVDTQMILAREFGYVSPEDSLAVEAKIQEMQKMIHTLVTRLPKRKSQVHEEHLSTIH
jgi:four helix bundle protein